MTFIVGVIVGFVLGVAVVVGLCYASITGIIR